MKSLISGMVVVAVMMALLLPAVSSAQALEECQDPPGNNEIAALIVKAVEAVRPILSNGIPELGIPPLDPLGPLPNIAFHIDVPRLRMDGLLNETVVRHISEFIICQLNFTLGITEKLELDIRLEDFRIDGYYDVDGLALSLFPVFGNGNFSLDVYEAAVGGGAKISYNPLSDHASIKDLHLDINFDRLVLVMECILGCGDMSDLINGLIDEIAPVVFDAVWGVIDPILTSALENGINDILKNISISDIITLTQTGRQRCMVGSCQVSLLCTETA
ncbi:hypothetical protein OTU49_006781 [Cherax quadricarinatus]|uniref:Uncharacterized protein n=1 Tax=Cherax quadricarinatus TaxID=27406 RepID=A0AAW0X0D6_CHEQU